MEMVKQPIFHGKRFGSSSYWTFATKDLFFQVPGLEIKIIEMEWSHNWHLPVRVPQLNPNKCGIDTL